MKTYYTCPCCGYKTLQEMPPGTHEICKVCGWEDDAVQARDPNFKGGANKESLKEYQAAFRKDYKHRPAKLKGFVADEYWLPLA